MRTLKETKFNMKFESPAARDKTLRENLAGLAQRVQALGGNATAAIQAWCEKKASFWAGVRDQRKANNPNAPTATFERIAGEYAAGTIKPGEVENALQTEIGRLTPASTVKDAPKDAPRDPNVPSGEPDDHKPKYKPAGRGERVHYAEWLDGMGERKAAMAKTAKPTATPTGPSNEMLGALITAVFGSGTLTGVLGNRTVEMDAEYSRLRETQGNAAARAYLERKAMAKGDQAKDREKMREFLYAHHVSVPGLSFEGLTPRPSPLTARQQSVCDRLTAEFFSTVNKEEKAVFNYSPAAKVAREFLASQKTIIQ